VHRSPQATALTHGLAFVTRNRRDFANAVVEVIDPFA
jgi:predicted nucleic acid-binding protein